MTRWAASVAYILAIAASRVARSAEEVAGRHPAFGEGQRAERMRRDDPDLLGDGEARRRGVDDVGRQPLRARRLAGAREDDVMIGDPGVGDPGLVAVEDVMP